MLEFTLTGITDASEAESIGRCLKNLFTTPAGSIPCDRDFGLSWAGLDMIPENMEPVYSLELIEKADRYEPRVKVTGVEFVHTDGGKTEVVVDVKRRKGIGDG